MVVAGSPGDDYMHMGTYSTHGHGVLNLILPRV
jgi:hypothetical protein